MSSGALPASRTPNTFARPDQLLLIDPCTRAIRLLWKGLGDNIDRYANYPRLVGETGTVYMQATRDQILGG